MKTIILNTAAHDNSGRFVDAGAEVSVGDGKDAIAVDRAKVLVGCGKAAEKKAAKADTAKSEGGKD